MKHTSTSTTRKAIPRAAVSAALALTTGMGQASVTTSSPSIRWGTTAVQPE